MAVTLTVSDKQKLRALLNELAGAVEDLLLSGLTTASESTRQTLNVAFQEASRMGLLRLGGTLRVANEELARFTKNQTDFSASRLSFFLNRSWLLSHAIARAIDKGDEQELDRLMLTPSSQPIDQLDVVTFGVALKMVANAFCAIDFRLRVVGNNGQIQDGQKLTWSCVYPIRAGADLPPEGYLHIPQKQKFRPIDFAKSNLIHLKNAAVSLDSAGGGRLNLVEHTTVDFGAAYEGWQRFCQWQPQSALARIRAHRPGPFDLEIEMQEEIVLDDWQLGQPEKSKDGATTTLPLTYKGTQLRATVSSGSESETLRSSLHALRKADPKPPMYGLMHYEKCNLIFQPLSVLEANGPRHLMLKGDKFDMTQLLKAMKF